MTIKPWQDTYNNNACSVEQAMQAEINELRHALGLLQYDYGIYKDGACIMDEKRRVEMKELKKKLAEQTEFAKNAAENYEAMHDELTNKLAEQKLIIFDHEMADYKGQVNNLSDTLLFVERWANHHGTKSCHTPESILSVIQHHPSIVKITNMYRDGVVPSTYDPYAEINELRAKLAELEKWKHAVDDAVTTTCGGPADWTDPRAMINHAIDWNVQVALDPLVSSDAKALIDRGREKLESQEPVAWRLAHRFYGSLKDAEYAWRNDCVFLGTSYVPEPLYAAAGVKPNE